MLDFTETKERAVGRWVDIFRSLGIDIDESGRHGPCPACSPGGKDRFRFDDKGRGMWFCNQCDPQSGDGFALVMKVLGYDIKEAMEAVAGVVGSCKKKSVPKEKTISKEVFRELFVKSKPADANNLVGVYLKSRGLSVIPITLRYSRKCWEPETKKEQHSMLAVVTSPDNTAVTMHRTYLDQDGDKLKIKSPKKLMPVLKKTKGGAIRLFPAGKILGLAEGIESAIAAHEDTGVPVWAAISTSGMIAFEPPSTVGHVVVFADNDSNYAGQRAAYSLAQKLSVINKIKVSVHVPNKPGFDWLDVLVSQKNIAGA